MACHPYYLGEPEIFDSDQEKDMRKLLYPAFVAALFTCLFLLGCGPDSGDDRLDGSGTAADSAGSLAITLLATDSVTVLDLLKVDHAVEYHSSAMACS